MGIATLPKLLQPALTALEKDLLSRAKTERVAAGLEKAWEDEQKASQTGLSFDPWRRERVTQLAVAWILSVVFVRTLEDRGYIDPRVAGASVDALRAAEDREALYLQVAPFLGPREYLLAVFRELSKLPGARDVFDTRHNPVWVLHRRARVPRRCSTSSASAMRAVRPPWFLRATTRVSLVTCIRTCPRRSASVMRYSRRPSSSRSSSSTKPSTQPLRSSGSRA
jgi:hypothetical protein